MKRTTLFLNLFLLLSSVVFAQTNVSGAISSDTTWSLTNSPYTVNGNILVVNGVTLTIEAGVTVNFSDGYKILVKGNLVSVGSSSSLITFNGDSTNYNDIMIVFKGTNLSNSAVMYNNFNGPQGALLVEDESSSINNSGSLVIKNCEFNSSRIYESSNVANEQLKFENCVFEYSAIQQNEEGDGTITLTNCQIKRSFINPQSPETLGIKIYDSFVENCTFFMGYGSNILIENSTLYNAPFYDGTNGEYSVTINKSLLVNSSIYLDSGDLSLSSSIVAFNNSYTYNEDPPFPACNDGVSSKNVNLLNSAIYGYKFGSGLNINVWYENKLNTITNCTFANNSVNLEVIGTNGDFTFDQNNFLGANESYRISNSSSKGVTTINNYWGTTTESEIQNLIFDFNDDIDKGVVDYTPFLTKLNTTAPISPPSNVTKTAASSDVVLNWSANGESDVAGYKLHYGTPTGYSYATTIDLGNVTTYKVTGGDISTEYAITVYDSSKDGTDDMVDGNESWYSVASQINVTPTLLDDSVAADEDTSIDITLNATDPDSNQITYAIVTDVSNGTVTIVNNIVRYTPLENFNGTDSFTVTANDGKATSSAATISITINAINDAPIANNNSILVNESATAVLLENNETTLLYNDTDVEKDPLLVILVSEPNYGSLILNTDGTFSYQHDGSETASDSFTYKTNDGSLDSNIARVSITIQKENDNLPSDIILSNNSIRENSSQNSFIGQLSAVDLDLPFDSHTFKLISGVGDDDNTSFRINGKNLSTNVTFDFETQENLSIRVKVIDENNQSYEKVFTIDIINVNDINITSETTNSYCSVSSGNGTINITSVNQATGTLAYNWQAYNGGIIPSGQQNSQNLKDLVNGTYSLSVSDANFTYYKNFQIGLIPQYNELSICYVSSDDSEQVKNRIYLNNKGNYNVAFYEILRESNVANVYTTIGTVASSENSFLDETSNNVSQSYNYKVRLIDNCGVLSSNSNLHKTILLQSSIAVNESVNLNWSDYQGTNYTTYNIFRNINNEGFQLIGSVSANSNSFNDATANVADNTYEYYISIDVNDCLNETAGKGLNTSTEVKSNFQIIGSSLSASSFINLKELSIYPNPANNKLNIKLSNGIDLIKGEVYNTLGQMVLETSEMNFSVKNLPSSTYFIKIFTSKGMANRHFIKQ